MNFPFTEGNEQKENHIPAFYSSFSCTFVARIEAYNFTIKFVAPWSKRKLYVFLREGSMELSQVYFWITVCLIVRTLDNLSNSGSINLLYEGRKS